MSLRVDNFGPPPVSLAPSMFGTNATFGKTGDTNYTKFIFGGEGNVNLIVPDVNDTLSSTLPHLLEEIRNSSALPRSDEPNAVVDPIVPSDPSSLRPVQHAPTSTADKYSRTMLKCLAGYPLYKPDPFNNTVLSATNHLQEGIRVGDVGFIRDNGAFDILFSICPSQRNSSNPPGLPINFTLQGYENPEIYKEEEFRPGHTTRLFHHPVYRPKRLFGHTKYQCSEHEGAILELPEGATRMAVVNSLPFKELAMRYAVEWYRYTMAQGRDITNGSLYLVTSSTKCTHWGIAVVQQPLQGGLRFVHNKRFFRDRTRKYHWKCSGAFSTTSSPALDSGHGTALNQCVFLRGFKIKLRGDIWDDLRNEQSHEKPYIASADPKPAPLVHPSDLINATVLSQKPGAEIAITHDDQWRDLFREIYTSPKPLDFAKIAQSLINLIEENNSVSFEKNQRNSTLDSVNIHALAKSTRKTLKRLGPLCRLRPMVRAQDDVLVDKIVAKIKNLIDGIDFSMLATQFALTLANEALQLAEPTNSPMDQESSIVSQHSIEGLNTLAGIATLGEKYAQQSGTIFQDVAQELYEVGAMTKEKRDVIVIIPVDPEQPDITTKKPLHDIGLDLNANLNVFIDFAQHVSALANWFAYVSTAASQNTDPDAQSPSPTLPGAMTLLSLLSVDVWTKVQADYHSYFRTIRQVQSHYHNLVSPSFEAWQLSAKSIPLSSPWDGDRSTSPSPAPIPAPPPRTAVEDDPKSPDKKKGFNLRALLKGLSPRPEVKGLFPTSANSNKPIGSSKRKGKGKEKEKLE